LLLWFTFFGRCMVFLPKYDVESIQLVCRRIGVTHFFAIPLVWNKTVAALEAEVAKQGKTKTFNKAINFSNKLQNVFPLFGATVARGIIFKKVRRQLLGEKLRFLISGGGFVQPRTLEVLNGLGYSIHNGYGLTECGILSVELAKKPKYRNEGKVGVIFSNIAYKLAEDGELLIPNDHAMNGMYVDGVFRKNDQDYYATNDIVKIDAQGRLSIVGRKDDVIIGPNGENISPEEIESRISKGAYSAIALVYAKIPGTDSKQMILVLSDNGKLGAFELTTSLKSVFTSISSLSMMERPSKVVSLIGDMPENIKGVDRRALVAGIEESKLFFTECSDPSDEEIKRIRTDEYIKLIDTVCGVFAEVLGKDRSEITETSNFVALGGDSMQYVELLSKAGEKTGRQIMMTETPLITPMAIADYIITSTNKAEKDIS
jgi:long-subunit acyl-CoA synthetase (AMP-forming)/acyl carrier protein